MSREDLRPRAEFAETGVSDFDRLAEQITAEKVWQMSNLPAEERHLVSLAALASKGYNSDYLKRARFAIDQGLPTIKVQEVAIHISMYAGIPASGEILRLLQSDGLFAPPTETGPQADKPVSDRMRVGQQVKASLHGERAVLDYAANSSPASELYDVATELLYGDLWMRKGLSIRERMICSIASFTALSLVSQQRKFFQSAANVGLSKGEVVDIIGQCAPFSGFAPSLAAISIADSVISG